MSLAERTETHSDQVFGAEAPAQHPFLQLLDADGRVTPLGDTVGIDVELAQRLYADMAMARRFDQECLALQRQGELNLWLQSSGQEAAQVGSIRALRPTDMVFPSYREHAVALCRGITNVEMLRMWRGVSHSGWNPAKYHFQMYSVVLGTQALHATGYAAGIAMDGADEIAVAYFGDGAASEGDVSEALNWAAAASLPVLFICQNNQWAISTPTSTQMRTSLHTRAAGFGLDSYHVDGNDALAVHAVTRHAAERVRSGKGPALIEAQTYRIGGHSTSDDPTRYRNDADVALWMARDPLTRIERMLRREGVSDEFFTGLTERAAAFAATVREDCRGLVGGDLDEVFAHVYAEPHTGLQAEREAYRRLRAEEE